jgi:hypothetical protein
VNGIETLSLRWLGVASRVVEKLVIERPFANTWELGWRRLRKMEAQRDTASTVAEN